MVHVLKRFVVAGSLAAVAFLSACGVEEMPGDAPQDVSGDGREVHAMVACTSNANCTGANSYCCNVSGGAFNCAGLGYTCAFTSDCPSGLSCDTFIHMCVESWRTCLHN
jgi:hypothetical protein